MFFSALILCLVLPAKTTRVLIECVVVDEMTDGQSSRKVDVMLFFSSAAARYFADREQEEAEGGGGDGKDE